jgi:transcriptional regulator
LILKLIANSAVKSWSGMDGVANGAGAWKAFKSTTSSGAATKGMIPQKIL